MSRDYIASTLRRLREATGLTADQVGELVGKSGKTVNAWENNRGQPDAEMLMTLCDIYHVENILAEFNPQKIENPIAGLSPHEVKVITSYRSQPDMQKSVDRLLGVEDEPERAAAPEADKEKTVLVYRAARSETGEAGEVTEISEERWKKLMDAPETTLDL